MVSQKTLNDYFAKRYKAQELIEIYRKTLDKDILNSLNNLYEGSLFVAIKNPPLLNYVVCAYGDIPISVSYYIDYWVARKNGFDMVLKNRYDLDLDLSIFDSEKFRDLLDKQIMNSALR